jgi:hypothetical protein
LLKDLKRIGSVDLLNRETDYEAMLEMVILDQQTTIGPEHSVSDFV